jgi:hypothetical protein
MPIIAFFSVLFSRIGQVILTKWLTGALTTVAIYTVFLGSLALVIFTLVRIINDLLLDLINGLPPISQSLILGIASFLPPNMPYLITAVLTYYTVSAGLYLSLEIAKLKAVWAEKALGSFKA